MSKALSKAMVMVHRAEKDGRDRRGWRSCETPAKLSPPRDSPTSGVPRFTNVMPSKSSHWRMFCIRFYFHPDMIPILSIMQHNIQNWTKRLPPCKTIFFLIISINQNLYLLSTLAESAAREVVPFWGCVRCGFLHQLVLESISLKIPHPRGSVI